MSFSLVIIKMLLNPLQDKMLSFLLWYLTIAFFVGLLTW
jgi:hypothetical protein